MLANNGALAVADAPLWVRQAGDGGSEPEPDGGLAPSIGSLSLPLVGTKTEGEVPSRAGLVGQVTPEPDDGASQGLSVRLCFGWVISSF